MRVASRTMRFFTADERPDLAERYAKEAEEFWPPHMEFVYHDPVCEQFWPRLNTEFSSFQFIVYDEAEDRFLAQGNTIPFAWSGRDEDLPAGVPAVLTRAFGEREEGRPPTSLCALLAGVQPKVKATGLSAELLRYMKAIARRHGLSSLVAPARPNLKERYPLTPMERYAEWRRRDGLLFDPWLRTHPLTNSNRRPLLTMRCETVAVDCHRLPIGLVESFLGRSHLRPVVEPRSTWTAERSSA